MSVFHNLQGTVSSDKNELLFTQFDTNYNDLPQMHRKGTIIIWDTAEGGQVRRRGGSGGTRSGT